MLPIVLGLFFIAYLAFMVLATSLEANLSLNTRYAFPIYVTTMIMMTIILAHTAGVGGHVERIGHAFMILAAIVLASHVVRTADRTHIAYLQGVGYRSEEHTSELQSLMRIAYADFCLKTQNNKTK